LAVLGHYHLATTGYNGRCQGHLEMSYLEPNRNVLLG